MQEIDVHQTPQAPNGPYVWILTKGEMYNGAGDILGVYMEKHLAKGDFLNAAASIPFQIDKVWQEDDGAVHVEGHCDFVDLIPHPVVTRDRLT